jgi:hypothetical protein
MAANGERASRSNGGANIPTVSRGATPSTLEDLGIPRDRASRAMQLADVPEDQFEAALSSDRWVVCGDIRIPKGFVAFRDPLGVLDLRSHFCARRST